MHMLKPFFIFMVCLAAIGLLADKQQTTGLSGELQQVSDASWQSLAQQDLSLNEQGQQLHIIELNHTRSELQIYRMLRGTGDRSGNYIFQHQLAGTYTMSAQGVDKKQHLVNSYLEGFQPFPTENVATPLYVLAQRKQYLLDEQQYPGRPEVWQSSRQAYYYGRGDCEDHAIALADWLIEMGEDARVVVGDMDGNGHAWVVLLKNGREYLLEATRKNRVNRNSAYPLTSLHRDYHPEYMFNREFFWENTGSKYTTDYSSQQWRKRSQILGRQLL